MSEGPAASGAAVRPPVQRLTLEEKVWFDRRKSDIQQCAGFGGALGSAVTGVITIFGPYPRRVQLAAMLGGAIIGGGVGYLYADNIALARVQDLSASSNLRKQYQQLYVASLASPRLGAYR
ncbi:hypothetical protein BBJ28_00019836 [Nothophytophthora sp. Chile5]|nr:hypothetical protein BBJ28_00019836 [Nothophytophthora sp. Chile5]